MLDLSFLLTLPLFSPFVAPSFSFFFFTLLSFIIILHQLLPEPLTMLLVLNFSKQNTVPLCQKEDVQSYYLPLVHCISGTTSKRWIPIQSRPSGSLSSVELEVHGVDPEDFFEDLEFWRSALRNYWPLLSPLIFSDHPKRPDHEDPKRPDHEDPLPPYDMIRNVMDMNGQYGGLNAAFVEARKLLWI